MSQSMTGADAIIKALRAEQVDTIFGIPGAQIYPLFDAIYQANLNLIVPRHEQSAAYMAMGYAKSSGRVGVFSVVPGPGVLNASAALCTAMGTCTPVLGLTGQVPSAFMGQGRGHLHELPDQAGTLRSFIKAALHIPKPADAPAIIRDALTVTREGRPGPVVAEMCWDTMAQMAEPEVDVSPIAISRPQVNLDAVAEAVKLICAAKRPMIMCGAGAQHAASEVQALAELLCAPVTAFRSGRGVVAEDHPLGLDSVAGRELWDETDLLIGIGSRCEMPYMRWGDMMVARGRESHPAKLIRIDIDPDQMRSLEPDVALIADSVDACRALIASLESRVTPDTSRQQSIAAAKQIAARAVSRIQPQAEYLGIIRELLPRDGFLVPELCQAGFTSYTGAFPVLAPRTYVTEGYQGTLGFGFPTSLGVKIANPDKVVVSISGDGGFMFGVQELMTASQFEIGVIAVVFNNNAYGNVLRDQQQRFGGRVSGSALKTPDFQKLAESFDVQGYQVTSPDAFRSILGRAIESAKPALIEVVCPQGSETAPWDFIHMASRPSQIMAR